MVVAVSILGEADNVPFRREFLRDVGFFEFGKDEEDEEEEEDKESIEVEEPSVSDDVDDDDDDDDDDVGSLSLFDSPSSFLSTKIEVPSLVVISTETSIVVAIEVEATDLTFSSTI
jgi:hypothetical protein